jgi:hypothetical protein
LPVIPKANINRKQFAFEKWNDWDEVWRTKNVQKTLTTSCHEVSGAFHPKID